MYGDIKKLGNGTDLQISGTMHIDVSGVHIAHFAFHMTVLNK